jgi:hypothetical protein
MPFVLNSIDKSTPLGQAIDNYVQHEKNKSFIDGIIFGISIGMLTTVLILRIR